jgi:hypothetical protein
MTKNILSRVVAGLIAAVALVAGISNVRQVSAAAKLRQDHATVSGIITSKSVGVHGMVEYMFAVGGKEYRARGVGGAEREFGANVTVYYSASDPSLSLLHDPLVWQSPGWPVVVFPLAIFLIGFCMAAGWVKIRPSAPAKIAH